MAESVSEDIHGNLTRMRVHRDRSTASETRHMESPSSPMAEVTVSRFGLTLTHRDTSGHERRFGWDALGRRISETDPRTGITRFAYDEKGRLASVTDAADHTTRFVYDNETGRKIQEIDAKGQSVRYAYDMRGQLTATWGDATYPVRYGYDALGRMVSMTTFREGEGFEGEAFPQDPNGDTTSWIYDEATGLLLAKRDAEGRDVTYQYDAAGRMSSRTWARQEAGADLVTTYAYDGATGDLLGVNYSDATPGVTFTYNRLGQQKTITDGLGTRTLFYNPALQPVSESITGLYERSLALGYEEMGLKGRISGFSLQSPDSKTYAISYGFDRFGRFESLNWEVLNQKDQVRYTRVQNADLIAGYETDSGQITSYTYEAHRNLKTRVENAFHTRLISAYTYGHDALGRRENVRQTGLAFVKDNFNLYTYNPRSEVTASRSFEGEDISDLNQALSERFREYSYDPMGNRRAATLGPEALEYSSNPLNQYTAVTGLASITHDADGNFKEMGDRVFVWNAENRLIRTEPKAAAAGDSRTEYAYDYMGRRVQKISYLFDGTDWVKEEERLFVYQGWNLIEEIRLGEGKEESRYFVWGLDLSQSLQGAGGVGGLLAMVEEGGSHLYTFDANGNVGQVVKTSDGSLAAAYEYDPFGRLTASSGGMAEVNPFRFSTKYFDGESGFYYYGYRYYAVELGRWISRDPIEEEGGINLYGFVGNDGLNWVDLLGLTEIEFRAMINFTLGVESGGMMIPKISIVVSGQAKCTENLRITADFSVDAYSGGMGTSNNSRGNGYELAGFLRVTHGDGVGHDLPVTLISRNTHSAFPDNFKNSGTWGGGYAMNAGTSRWTSHHIFAARGSDWAFDYQNDQGKYPFLPLGKGTDEGRTAKAILHVKLKNGAIVHFGNEQFTGIPRDHLNPNKTSKHFYDQTETGKDLNRSDTFAGVTQNGQTYRLGASGSHWAQNFVHRLKFNDVPLFEQTDQGRGFVEIEGGGRW
ncbi:RHS repeat domain-containing protein [Desulfobotulus alkaliphilus]|uniref:RHS repeat domain-containing protein n=1 Tax=Desulfobotulus alkaliphilus TaxID=622671 RepID=UPI0011A695EB|nr:RHS repeat-associated core domain-containing protein [Desulfobotulus alkaliphilus]